MNSVAFYIAAAAVVALSSFVAFYYGRKRGIALGWLEHYEQTVARDRARRDKRGQFKAMGART